VSAPGSGFEDSEFEDEAAGGVDAAQLLVGQEAHML
jgi:hypothetical protein